MNLKTFYPLTILLLSLFMFVNAIPSNSQTNDSNNDENSYEIKDRLSYAYGILIAQQMKAQNMTAEDIDPVELAKALQATLEKDPTELPMDVREAQQEIQAFFQKKQEAKMREAETQAEPKRQEEEKWFAENVDNLPNIQKTETGVRYEILKKGTGEKPASTDKVKVHYHGTRTDGHVFDSSVDRGEPAVFPVSRLIPAWVEILQLMPTGSKWKIYVPFDQAYGTAGAGADIPPFTTLIFEIELISIEN